MRGDALEHIVDARKALRGVGEFGIALGVGEARTVNPSASHSSRGSSLQESMIRLHTESFMVRLLRLSKTYAQS